MIRHGKTIIELLVVITVFGALMTPMGRLLHTMMRSEREGAHALAASKNASRLAREFRSDVHAAREVELGDNRNGELKLSRSNEHIVIYRPGDEGLQRITTRGDETLSRDSFRLPPGTTRFEVTDDPQLVVLLHERHSNGLHPDASARTSVLRVEAVPGRDHRFTK